MTIEVLVYPNITYARNLEADSFICDLRSLLPRLTAALPDYRFTVLVPGRVESLSPYCEQIAWPLPSYPNTMRQHFDAFRFLEAVDWKSRSWDIVWSHLPEHTAHLKNVLYNATDLRPPIVGYSHWVEIPELHTMAADSFPAWLDGVLQMEYCGCTTAAMKETVLRRARTYLSDGKLLQLRRTLHPQYLGVEPPPPDDDLPDVEPGLLVWNHRPHTYTGWPSVLAALDALWDRRQDFRVTCTLSDGEVAGKPYGVPSGLPAAGTEHYRRDYFRLLARGYAGLPRLVSHWTWPVAIADGMAAGLPYVVPQDFYVGEVFPAEYPWQYQGSGKDAGTELVDALDRALDRPEERRYAADLSLRAAEATGWDVRVERFVSMFQWVEDRMLRIGPRSQKYPALRAFAEAGATKAELKKAMGWGIGIPWTPYRNRLRDDGVPVMADRYGSWEAPDPNTGETFFGGRVEA